MYKSVTKKAFYNIVFVIIEYLLVN